MLFKRAVLEKIARGEVTLAFRRWRRPTVKAGGRLRTAAGVLAIEAVEPVAAQGIAAAEARRAGFADLAGLRAELAKGREGTLYRIEFRLAGDDPRVALRKARHLDADELAALRDRLERLDAASRDGAWTAAILGLIAEREGVAAVELAAVLGLDRARFKRRVRRLKEAGLTESLAVGYRLSPRGQALLAKTSR